MKVDTENRAYTLIFESWDEFVEFAAKPSIHGRQVGTSARSDGRELSWSLGHDFDQCVEFGRKGWKQPVAEVEGLAGHVEQTVEVEVFDSSFQSHYDVAGAEVDVAVYLSGEPECMIESEAIRISRHGRAVRIVVPHYTSCGVNAEAFRRRGAAIVALCDGLAKRQHPVEVVVLYQSQMIAKAGSSAKRKWQRYQYLVPIQRADEPLDVERLLAAVAHPGAFRRLGFAVVENTPDLEVAAGLSKSSYGSIVSESFITPEVDRLLGQVDNTIIPQDLNCYNERKWSELETAKWVVGTIDQIFA